jgi:hypothetical protein
MKMRQRHYDLDKALEKKEMQLVSQKAKEPALDYIIKDHSCRVYFNSVQTRNRKRGNAQDMTHDWEKEEEANRLTVKLKNAVMIYWLEEKKKRQKKSFEQVIKEYLQSKKNKL